MQLGISVVGAAVAAIVGLGGLWLRSREIADSESRRILRDIEILKALPDDSSVNEQLRQQIDSSVQTMLQNRVVKRRGGSNLAIGVIMLCLAIPMTLLTLRGGWWLVLAPTAVFFGILAVYGIVEGSIKGERDAKGNLVRKRSRSQVSTHPERIGR